MKRSSTRSLAVSAAFVAAVASGAQAVTPREPMLPFPTSGILGRLDIAGAGHSVEFDTSTGRYAVDGVQRDARPVTLALPDAVVRRSGKRTVHAFDFASIRLGAGTRVTARGADPLVILSRGDADIAAPIVLDGAVGRSGGKGAGGGGGGGGGAVAILSSGTLTVTGAISVRGGAGGLGDARTPVAAGPTYDGGPGGGGGVLLGAARGGVVDTVVLTWSGDRQSAGPVTVVGPVDFGAHASVNGLAPDAAGVRRLPALPHAAFDVSGGGGGGGGGGSGLPVGDDTRGYVRTAAAGGAPGAGGGAGGTSGYAVAGGSGGNGGNGATLGAGGGGGGGGGAFAGPGGAGGAGFGAGAPGGPGGAGGAGTCFSGATGGSGGNGGNGGVTGGSGGDGGDGGNSGGESGDDGSDATGVGAGGGGAGGGGDACGTSGSGAGGAGGAGAIGGASGSSGKAGSVYRGTTGSTVSAKEGSVCRLLAVPDAATPQADMWHAQIHAGPMTKGMSDGVSGRLTCSVQVGSDTHDSPDDASVTAEEFDDGLYADHATARYHRAPADVVYLCATYQGAETLYWNAVTADWSTAPGLCELTITTF